MRPLFDKILSYILSVGLASAVVVIGLSVVFLQQQSSSADAEEEVWPAPFTVEDDLLVGRAAAVYDVVGEQMLFEKNAEEALPLASLTKLIAAETVLAYIVPDQVVSISTQALKPEGDSGFWVGEKWEVGDLIRFSLVASSNDAIAAAVEALGPDYMSVINNEASKLGLEQTHATNPTGLDESPTVAGGYGSARDMAHLAAAFLKKYPTFFEATAAPYVTITGPRTLTATSTAGPLRDIPGLIGAKTGYTDLAGGNLVAAFDLELGRPLIVAVLGSTREGRFKDVKLLLEAARRK
jgi:D-alanyl-D-alanine carboxypeptidase